MPATSGRGRGSWTALLTALKQNSSFKNKEGIPDVYLGVCYLRISVSREGRIGFGWLKLCKPQYITGESTKAVGVSALSAGF